MLSCPFNSGQSANSGGRNRSWLPWRWISHRYIISFKSLEIRETRLSRKANVFSPCRENLILSGFGKVFCHPVKTESHPPEAWWSTLQGFQLNCLRDTTAPKMARWRKLTEMNRPGIDSSSNLDEPGWLGCQRSWEGCPIGSCPDLTTWACWKKTKIWEFLVQNSILRWHRVSRTHLYTRAPNEPYPLIRSSSTQFESSFYERCSNLLSFSMTPQYPNTYVINLIVFEEHIECQLCSDGQKEPFTKIESIWQKKKILLWHCF